MRWFRAFGFAAFLALGCGAATASEMVVTAQSVANTFLAAFNGHQRTVYETYLRERWPGFKTTDEFADMRAQTGGYNVVEIKEATAKAVEEVVKSRLADDYFTFKVEIGEESGHPIKSLSFTPTDRPLGVPAPQRVSAADVGHLVDNELAAMGDFSGAVMFAVNGRGVYSRAEGLADRTSDIPNTTDTRFRIASMGKMFTAVAIMQLNQAGKLDLDATVSSFITDYPNTDFARTVTVRELLTHTGGAGDFMSKKWADNYTKLNTPADYITLFGTRPPEFKPGSKFSYANYGYVVLGRIVEVASAQSYEDYLRDHIFEPSGMTHSGLNAPPIETSVLAVAYVKTAAGY